MFKLRLKYKRDGEVVSGKSSPAITPSEKSRMTFLLISAMAPSVIDMNVFEVSSANPVANLIELASSTLSTMTIISESDEPTSG